MFKNFAALLYGSFICFTACGSFAQEKIDYTREVLPILSKKCYACHGPDEASREGGLGLHSRILAIGKLDSGAMGIVPGNAQDSEVFRRVSADDEFEIMPPDGEGTPLNEHEIQIIERWINQGANFDLHWAYQPLTVGEPVIGDDPWIRNPVDFFVQQKLKRNGVSPNPEADKGRLLRRLSLDLTGLPPTPLEMQQFLDDDSADAYEKQVDRLLASPKYGEHWARKWLDLARYADSQGYAQDELRTIWQYRDWVIRALNQDMPFDQFSIEQLAGDLLDDATSDQMIATAFHRNTMTNTEGGTDDEEFRFAAVVDRTNTTMQVWLGTTMGCAQCHSHKYDPITHAEYYQVFAIFNQTADTDQPDNRPTIETPTRTEAKKRESLISKIEEKKKALKSVADDDKAQMNSELEQLQKQLNSISITHTPIMQELPPDKRRETHIAIRGSFAQQGQVVSAGLPKVFFDGQEAPIADRLQLAQWLVSENNALTARVAANRHWEQLFGVGLVETSEDFGTQGTAPSHPELLDWLANDFITNGWSMKKLCKRIVMSATYRQSAKSNDQKNSVDPGNRLLSRGPRHRLSAEQIRDYALFVSGLLSDKMFGPPVRPPQPRSGLNAAFGGSLDWEPSKGEDRYRRGIYTLWRRTNPYPSMEALDATDRKTCTVRRIQTNTPVGVFVTLNDPVFVECAQALARKIDGQHGDTVQKIKFAFETVLLRKPSNVEVETIEQLFVEERQAFEKSPDNARQMATSILGDPSPEANIVDLAAWTVVANTLLNLDETLNK
jgi:hypothetical protein